MIAASHTVVAWALNIRHQSGQGVTLGVCVSVVILMLENVLNPQHNILGLF